MLREEIYVVDGARTPFCKFGTELANEPPYHLGVSPAKSIITSTGLDPNQVDEVVFGCCNQPANVLGNISRTIAVRCGIPDTIPAVTVHRNCASGFEAITYACDKAAAGKGDVFLVGGVESMSRAHLLFSDEAAKKFTMLNRSKSIVKKIKQFLKFRPSDFKPEVSLKKAMNDPLCDMNMGQTAELLAREYGISRLEQDIYAEQSHLKAVANMDKLEEEISPFNCTEDNCIRSFSTKFVTTDNGPRMDTNVSKLGKLRPVFDKKGTVTPGNASQVTDGGAALLLMTRRGLEKTNCVPIAKITDYTYAGCDPRRMGLGPVYAITKLAGSNSSFRIQDMDLIEINEAFAAQVLACQKHLGIPSDKLNVNGGAIALGHPLAATGARLVLTLSKDLKRKGLRKGLASLCVGGGQGGAICLEKI